MSWRKLFLITYWINKDHKFTAITFLIDCYILLLVITGITFYVFLFFVKK